MLGNHGVLIATVGVDRGATSVVSVDLDYLIYQDVDFIGAVNRPRLNDLPLWYFRIGQTYTLTRLG